MVPGGRPAQPGPGLLKMLSSGLFGEKMDWEIATRLGTWLFLTIDQAKERIRHGERTSSPPDFRERSLSGPPRARGGLGVFGAARG